MCVLPGTAGQAARQFDEERMTVQRFYRVHRFLGQLCRKLSAFLQTEQRRKRGFLACRILADGFSECCGISLDIEDIVLNLERQTQLFAVSACPSEGVLVGRTRRPHSRVHTRRGADIRS